MIMQIKIRLPGSGFKASNPGGRFWDPPLKTPHALEAGPQNFQRQLVYWSWTEVEGCTALTFRGKKWSIFIAADETEAQVEKYAHIFFSPSTINSALTGTGHVYAVDGSKLNKSRALKRLLFTASLDEQFCINPLLTPGSPHRALRPPPSSSPIMTITACASRQGQLLPPERKTGQSESGPLWDTYCITG